jgi:hypothetical protein
LAVSARPAAATAGSSTPPVPVALTSRIRLGSPVEKVLSSAARARLDSASGSSKPPLFSEPMAPAPKKPVSPISTAAATRTRTRRRRRNCAIRCIELPPITDRLSTFS